jgi:hypothetical protein
VVLGVPAVHGELVVLVQQEPLLLAEVVDPGADENEAATQLPAEQVDVQLALLDRPSRVRRVAGVVRFPAPGMMPSKSKYSSGWSST